MKELNNFLYVATICNCIFAAGHAAEEEDNKCYFSNDGKNNDSDKLIEAISSLIGKSFATQKDGCNYNVAICSDASKSHKFASVTMSRTQNETVVLGRRNDTALTAGDSWLVLKFGSGDPKKDDKKCLGPRRASVYIVCKPESRDDQSPNLSLTEEENGCSYKFVLPTSHVCSHDDETSGLKIFMIMAAVSMSVYCLVGIAYRRFFQNAQRCQQIPHFKFWRKIGNSLADACDYMCRCNPEQEESWDNLTRNFDSDDRDDALLRP